MISTAVTQGRQHRESKKKLQFVKRSERRKRAKWIAGGKEPMTKAQRNREDRRPASLTRAKPNVPKKDPTLVMVHFGVSETMPHPDVQRWGREPSKLEKFDQNKGWEGGERRHRALGRSSWEYETADQGGREEAWEVGKRRKARR